MQALDLESLYPVPGPVDGGQRAFNWDVLEMDLPTVQAETWNVRHRLFHERRMHPRLWLVERLRLLAIRETELRS